jgi:hypothetical protein
VLKKILIALAVIVAVLVVVIATRPDTFRIERSAEINAAPSVVFAQVNDFHKWEAWSPWAKLDPNMKQTFEGSPSGQGAINAWAGNDQVGEGRMTIMESKPPEHIGIKLEFLKPWTATNDTTFDFKGEADKTKVTWAMSGNNNFASKAMSLFMSMDEMVGKDFEKGLVQLKTVSEAEAKRLAEEAQAKAAAEAAAAAAQQAQAPAEGQPAAQ